MKPLKGPFASVAFNKQVAANAIAPLTVSVSGEITTNVSGNPIGAARTGGRISDVWISVAASGKDDTNTLSLTTDVLINGTSCLTTAPVIAHVSGEASQQKTTKVTGDTGVTQAVMDADNNIVAPGDVITYDLAITRTASPTTEMSHSVVVIEFEPAK